MVEQMTILFQIAIAFAGLLLLVTVLTNGGNLDNIKSRTVGDGQHGTARWATRREIVRNFARVKFRPLLWRKGKKLPTSHQGLIVGCTGRKGRLKALVDEGDVHAMPTVHPPRHELGELEGKKIHWERF